MATVYGKNKTKTLANPAVIVDQANFDCKIRGSYDSYDLGGAILADGVIIELCTIPKGARVVDVLMRSTDLGGTTSTLKCGITGSDACFIAATDVSGQAIAVNPAAGAAGILGSVLAAEAQVIVTHAGTCVATTGKVEVLVSYILD